MSFDPARVRADVPAFAEGRAGHYLDNAATAQVPRAVIEAVARHDARGRANVQRGVHALAEETTAAYEAARARVARYLSAAPDEIVLTAGATAAINLVAHAFGATLGPGDEIAVSRA